MKNLCQDMSPDPHFPDKKTRERWWLLCYALTAMQQAAVTARQILECCQSNSDPLFLPLTVAMHSFYARPFMKNRGVGCIEDSFVPSDASGIHDCLIKFRCSAYCHTDTTNIENTDQPWSDVVYVISNGIREINTITPWLSIEHYKNAIPHFIRMEKLFFNELRKLNEAYVQLIPIEAGEYTLRIDTPSNQLFTPRAPVPISTYVFEGKKGK